MTVGCKDAAGRVLHQDRRYAGMKIQDHVNCLGAMAGPGAQVHWPEVLDKARLHVGDIRLQGRSLSARVYQRALCHQPQACARRLLQDHSIQKVTRAPWQSIPITLTLNLPPWGFPMSDRDLLVEGQLAMCRAAAGCLGRHLQSHRP